jgi:outer membrane protein assembly factor BamB
MAAARKAGDSANAPSYHPLLLGERIFFNDQREIQAIHAADGRPVWGETSPAIFRDQMEGIVGAASLPPDVLGVPRFTMTALDGRLYARMGSPITCRPQQPSSAAGGSYLACIDLEAEGKLLWKAAAEEGWAFEGSPLADATGVYVAMRRSDIRPQAHVACFDAQTGRLRWRRFICGAETPARGQIAQCTHNLLALRGETIYYNTNLGAVAALSTNQGRLLWISLYPRARRGDLAHLASHWQRDLNPCLCTGATLLVAPADSPCIFAFDAGTGQILWRNELEDVGQLLGVAGDCLIASGRRLYWIGLSGEHRGRLKHVWPDSQEKLGYGRGVLADGNVLWPTRDKLYVFDQQTAQPKKAIDLASLGVSGGNLLVARGRLLIASATELVALGRPAKENDEKPVELTTDADR